jgi:hypothetical protein
MPVALRSTSTGTASVGNITVTKPSGVVDGDFLIAIAWSDDALVHPTAPAGWTAVGTAQSVSGVGVGKVWTQVAASEPASEVWTGSGSATSIVHVLACTGADTTGLDAGPTWANSATASTTRTAAAVSPAGADDLLIVSFASLVNNAGADGYTVPSGMTEQYDGGDATNPYYSSALDTQILAASGSTGTRVSTATRSSKWQAVTLAVKSAAAAASTPFPPARRRGPNFRR